MTNEKVIPIFYACDDNFVKYTIVSLHSMIKNANSGYKYRVYILHTGISEQMKERTYGLSCENFKISFEDVGEYLKTIYDKLPIRDYYSKTTYYRFCIAEMFPEYKKAIYIDSDTVVNGDISKLFETDIGDAYVGACHEQAMVQVDEYGTYVERVVGVSRYNFFNAGMMLINCEKFREKNILQKFIHYLGAYTFRVTQDEDYLNLICKDRVFWLDERWNTEVFGEIPYPISEAYIIHYIMTSKPWHYSDCRYGEIFWGYAKETSVYEDVLSVLNSYTDEERERDRVSCDNLLRLAVEETLREDNYQNRLNATERAKDRVEIVKKIEKYEMEGRFDEDVEDDPPSRVLLPDEIDYLRKGPINKLKSRVAFFAARAFVRGLIKKKQFIVKEIKGIDNYKNLKSGAVITCNHFNAYDSFAMQMAYDKACQPKRKFYRVIREGNYTSFPGFYGYLMRNCDTLPLSSDKRTMHKFIEGVNSHLKDGNFVLFYPEQSMWWNYRKPKPLKAGAFSFASKNDVPILPCFITMKDSDIMGDDGYPVQEYTVHIGEPIYPDSKKSHKENTENMMRANSMFWQMVYEREYGMPLYYIGNSDKVSV